MANMNSKQGNLQYYKGRGGTNQGRLTSKGKFLLDWTRLKFIMSPGNLTDFSLKPYVEKAPGKKTTLKTS